MTTMTLKQAIDELDPKFGITAYCSFDALQAWAVIKDHLAKGAQVDDEVLWNAYLFLLNSVPYLGKEAALKNLREAMLSQRGEES